MVIWSILRPFGVFYGYLVYIFSTFGILYQENSGNPGLRRADFSSGEFLGEGAGRLKVIGFV
jgi:hypothetical protein